jgi:hypothetical protein
VKEFDFLYLVLNCLGSLISLAWLALALWSVPRFLKVLCVFCGCSYHSSSTPLARLLRGLRALRGSFFSPTGGNGHAAKSPVSGASDHA